jgi:cytochrome c biogenesis protein CcdA/glutaredoxin
MEQNPVSSQRLAHIIAIAMLVSLCIAPQGALAESPLQVTIYTSPLCGSCRVFDEEILPGITQGYGERLVITTVDILRPEGLALLEAEEKRLGKPNNPSPVIVIGDLVIANHDVWETEAQFRAALLQRLGQPAAPGEQASATPSSAPTPPGGPAVEVACTAPIYVALVEKDGCDTCSRAKTVLQALALEHTGMVVQTFNQVRDAEIVEAMGAALGLPSERRMIAPSIYVGRHALVDQEINSANVREALRAYQAIGAPPLWNNLDTSTAKQSIVDRFRSMGPLAVVAAALIDGINPCAFATILFFVSYLAISRRRRRELILIGLAFSAGVFITYLLVGLGAMSLLRLLDSMRMVGLVLYTLMAISCFVLAGFSIYDYTLARQGKLHDMRLNLPDPLRERIKVRIRAASGAYAGAAFVSGLLVSLLELACTGQVYLPTISFVVSIPEMRANAILYLVLYNVVFIMPLIVVMLLAAYGVSATRFQSWFTRHVATAKLIMVALFLLLGGLLMVQVLSL